MDVKTSLLGNLNRKIKSTFRDGLQPRMVCIFVPVILLIKLDLANLSIQEMEDGFLLVVWH